MAMSIEQAAAAMVCVGFDGPAVNDDLRALLRRGVRSVILFTRNHLDRAQLQQLCTDIQTASPAPVLICTDHEGGRVQRFREGFTALPSLRTIGSRGHEAEARQLGERMADELRSVGIHFNLAPVLDVDSNPKNPVIGERSFGRDPDLVARLGAAMIAGMQTHGVGACGKHFPGHGDTSVDSHLCLPKVEHAPARLREVELPPFAAAVRAGVAAMMVAHIVFPAIDPGAPATMSRRIVTDMLRVELGFRGLVCSDDLEMAAIADNFGIPDAVVRGAAAGIDLFMICHRADRQHAAIDALANAARHDASLADHMHAANRRLQAIVDAYAMR